MRVIYVPRPDATKIVGGDIIHAQYLQHKVQQMGVAFDLVPVDDLKSQGGADALYLTQIYQIDVAERALQWANERGVPVFISPLWEDSLSMNFHGAIGRPGKWRTIAMIVGRKTAKLLYVQWHTARRMQYPIWRRQRELLQGVHVIANTNRELSHTCKWFNLAPASASIIRLGVDPAVFHPSGADKGDLPSSLLPHANEYILQVGLISTRKNQVGLLHALKNIDRPIVFVGQFSAYEPAYCEQVRALAATQGQVIFLHSIGLQALAAVYRCAALHILPSWSERPGLVTLEAAACGCRAIASHGASVDEYLGDRIGYCAPDGWKSITDSVDCALRSQNTTTDTSEFVRSMYTWDNTASRLVATFSSHSA